MNQTPLNMASKDASSALTYHDATKHSEISMRMSGHYLDWNNRPSPFKMYKNLPSIALPRDFPNPREASLNAINGGSPRSPSSPFDIGVLAEILFFSAGLTRKTRIGGDFHYMRAASATGALYPIELYVVSGGIPGLNPGVYHFNPFDFSLTILREGNYLAELVAATGEASTASPITLVFTSLAWRNAWKYEARSYRHWFWDSGVIAANLLAITNSLSLATNLVVGFVDSEVDRLLGLEKGKEATVALAFLGSSRQGQTDHRRQRVSPLRLETEPLSRDEVGYPIIWETNDASQFHTRSEIVSWKMDLKPGRPATRPSESKFPLRPSNAKESPPLDEVILRRGSTRRFAHQPISFEQLSTIIQASAVQIPFDFLPENQSLIDFYVIANEVQGLPPGSYFYNRESRSIEQLKAVKNRTMSGYLCLEQQLFSDASVVFFLMTDLQHVVGSLGNRGYRAAQFEAGIRAGKLYLSSYALGIGASGSTFFDDAVTEFFSPHAKDKSTMIAVGVGVPAYKARPGRILPQLTTRS